MPAPRLQLPAAAAVVVAVVAVVLLLGGGRDVTPDRAERSSPAQRSSSPAGGATPAADGRPLLFGASAPTRAAIEQTEQDLGRRLGGVRQFRRWGTPLFDQDDLWAADGGRILFLSIKGRYDDGQVIPFARIAGARPGSPLYADMVQQARELKEFGRPIYVTFNHEPDADPENGGAAAFVAAWRTWVSVLRAEGADNARFVWTTTAFGYGRADDRAAPLFWPGDGWTDLIGVDAYNSYRCNNAEGPWLSPEALLGPVMAFAAQHPEHPVVLMEWSSVEDPVVPSRKGDWFRELVALLQQPAYRQVVGLLQWGGDFEFLQDQPGCDYHYGSSPQSVAAFRELGALPALGVTELPALGSR